MLENRELFVYPDCCETARKSMTIRLRYLGDSYPSAKDENDIESVVNARPSWVLLGQNYEDGSGLDLPRYFEAKCCPFCSSKMPEIRLKKKEDMPEKICRFSDGGYHCDCCGERLHACDCSPAWFCWEIAR